MKKTLITLLALSGLAMSAELTYTGADGAWFETAGNWTLANGQTSKNKPVDGDKLTIDGKAVNLGNNDRNHTFNEIDLTIQGGGSLTSSYGYTFSDSTITIAGKSSMAVTNQAVITGSTITIAGKSSMNVTGKAIISGSTITIENGSSMTLSGSDSKIGKGTVWNVYSEKGLTLGNQWLDDTAYQGKMTFNLGEEGSVHYDGTVSVNRITSPFPSFALTANCEVEIPAGSSVVTFTRELVTFTSSAVFTKDDIDYLNNHLSGTFTCNGITLTQGDLTGACQYALAYDATKNAIVLSYTAPEPATATLSLLALAGLAARRKRK